MMLFNSLIQLKQNKQDRIAVDRQMNANKFNLKQSLAGLKDSQANKTKLVTPSPPAAENIQLSEAINQGTQLVFNQTNSKANQQKLFNSGVYASNALNMGSAANTFKNSNPAVGKPTFQSTSSAFISPTNANKGSNAFNMGSGGNTFKNSNTSPMKPAFQTSPGLLSPNNLSNGRGAIRQSLKFDYQIGNMKIPSNKIYQITQKPSANVFSCMDNPNYQRQFEVSPKIMHG